MPDITTTLHLTLSQLAAVETEITNVTSVTGHMLGRLARGVASGLAELITEVVRAYTMAHISPFLPANRQGNRSDASRF